MQAIANGYFLTSDSEAHAALISLRSDRNIRAEKAKAYLSLKGARAGRSPDEARLLARAFYKAERGEAGTARERAEIWALIDREAEWRFAEALTQSWLHCVPPNELVPGDLLILRAAAARRSNNAEVAIECCRRAHHLRNRYQTHQLAVLATEGAAALLDQFDQTHAAALVTEAEGLLRYAWAKKPSEYVSAVYNRLRRAQSIISQDDEGSRRRKIALAIPMKRNIRAGDNV
jgi:hypothetical protein